MVFCRTFPKRDKKSRSLLLLPLLIASPTRSLSSYKGTLVQATLPHPTTRSLIAILQWLLLVSLPGVFWGQESFGTENHILCLLQQKWRGERCLLTAYTHPTSSQSATKKHSPVLALSTAQTGQWGRGEENPTGGGRTTPFPHTNVTRQEATRWVRNFSKCHFICLPQEGANKRAGSAACYRLCSATTPVIRHTPGTQNCPEISQVPPDTISSGGNNATS